MSCPKRRKIVVNQTSIDDDIKDFEMPTSPFQVNCTALCIFNYMQLTPLQLFQCDVITNHPELVQQDSDQEMLGFVPAVHKLCLKTDLYKAYTIDELKQIVSYSKQRRWVYKDWVAGKKRDPFVLDLNKRIAEFHRRGCDYSPPLKYHDMKISALWIAKLLWTVVEEKDEERRSCQEQANNRAFHHSFALEPKYPSGVFTYTYKFDLDRLRFQILRGPFIVAYASFHANGLSEYLKYNTNFITYYHLRAYLWTFLKYKSRRPWTIMPPIIA